MHPLPAALALGAALVLPSALPAQASDAAASRDARHGVPPPSFAATLVQRPEAPDSCCPGSTKTTSCSRTSEAAARTRRRDRLLGSEPDAEGEARGRAAEGRVLHRGRPLAPARGGLGGHDAAVRAALPGSVARLVSSTSPWSRQEVGVAPVSWSPEHLGVRRTRCRRVARRTRRSCGGSWWSWYEPGGTRRTRRGSPSPRRRRSKLGRPGRSRSGQTARRPDERREGGAREAPPGGSHAP